MVNKSLMQMLIEAGYPKEEMYNHESDLYIYATPLTAKALKEWCEANNWNSNLVKDEGFLFSTFTDCITGRKMYDIAFQYLPWWEEKCSHNKVTT